MEKEIKLQSEDLYVLTNQELKVINIAASGARNKDIANTLGIAEKTVKCHRQNIYKKLGVSTPAGIRKLLHWFCVLNKG
jgi:DNA-binding NarL/FixJ family response regulator